MKVGKKHIFLIENSRVLPWNIYQNHDHVDMTCSGNEIIEGKEWFNSYMPPFFNLGDAPIVAKLKGDMDRGCTFGEILKSEIGKYYLKSVGESLSREKVLSTVDQQLQRIGNYFEIEAKIMLLENKQTDLADLIFLTYLTFILTQTYLDPVEALTARKKNIYLNFLDRIFINENEQVEFLEPFFSLETTMIPLSVIYANGRLEKSFDANVVFFHVAKLLFCEPDDLEFALYFINKKFDCIHYMDLKLAEQILNNNSKKIRSDLKFSLKQQLSNKIQLLNAIISWSKYIPQSKYPLKLRFEATNGILSRISRYNFVKNSSTLLRNIKTTNTSAGSEKYGKLIFLLRTISENSPTFWEKVLSKKINI